MNSIDIKKLNDILDSKEERANKQIQLLKEYPYTLISFTLNIPGIVKSSEYYDDIHSVGIESIISVLKEHDAKILNIETYGKDTGNEGYISIDLKPILVKRLMVKLENTHPLGRIFDIDVFDEAHSQISRTHIGQEPRQCLICNKDARICMREKNHTYEELISRIEELGKHYFR